MIISHLSGGYNYNSGYFPAAQSVQIRKMSIIQFLVKQIFVFLTKRKNCFYIMRKYIHNLHIAKLPIAKPLKNCTRSSEKEKTTWQRMDSLIPPKNI